MPRAIGPSVVALSWPVGRGHACTLLTGIVTLGVVALAALVLLASEAVTVQVSV